MTQLEKALMLHNAETQRNRAPVIDHDLQEMERAAPDMRQVFEEVQYLRAQVEYLEDENDVLRRREVA